MEENAPSTSVRGFLPRVLDASPVEYGGKTVLIHSPTDLSCRWNLRDRHPDDQATRLATQVGQNVVTDAISRQARGEQWISPVNVRRGGATLA
jgi:hypothetical protein